MAVNHPHFGTFCEICFRQLTVEKCAVDTQGVIWDVCAGECAVQAGIQEMPPKNLEKNVPDGLR